MTCMCGDTCCPSCGPAQGNSYCPNCRQWESDGGCVNPQECDLANKEYAKREAHEYLVETLASLTAQANGVSTWDIEDEFRWSEKSKLTNEQLEQEIKQMKKKVEEKKNG